MSAKQSALSKHFAKTRSNDESLDLEWKNVNFSIAVKDKSKSSFGKPVYKKKEILQNVSGRVLSGQLLAIMGPTGCGKTSLLNILAARVPSGGSKNASLSGSVKVNSIKRDENKFRSVSAYVLQDDNLYAHLTVLETLQLAATFFLPAETTHDERMILVEAVIAELGLVKARDTTIGDDKTRGVSGGERKRVSVAVQLISGDRSFQSLWSSLSGGHISFAYQINEYLHFNGAFTNIRSGCPLSRRANIRFGFVPSALCNAVNERLSSKRASRYLCHSSAPVINFQHVRPSTPAV